MHIDWGQLSIVLVVFLSMTKLWDWFTKKKKDAEREIKRTQEIETFKNNCISELRAQVSSLEKNTNAMFKRIDQMRNNFIKLNTNFATLVAVLKNAKVVNGIEVESDMDWGNE